MKAAIAKNIHFGLLAFLGIGAFGGGLALIISPSCKLLGGLPPSILARSPFSDFLFPGLILFTVLGLFPLLLVWALIKKPENKLAESLIFFTDMHWAWSFSIYQAFALIIWIQVETYFIQGVGWLQNFYMLFAIPMIFVALLKKERSFYKKI